MNMKFSVQSEQNHELRPRIVVVGVGGAGGNAVNNMINSNLEGCEFLVCNTDAQALEHSVAEKRIQLGLNITKGLGAGSRPEIGRSAAEEALDEIFEHISGAHMIFITAGMGGGTGTGAAPVIARIAREQGILTVGVVTKPFHFEGQNRMRLANAGIEELQQFVDTLIVIPNQNLFRLANEKTTFADAFTMADDVLYSGVRGVTDLMVMPGLINLDFADIRTVMSEMGKAMMGTGEADGEKRAISAAEAAISNPLLDDMSMQGAKGVLINITGGLDMTLFEVDEAANRIREEVDPNANIIFGSTFEQDLEGKMRVSVVATGIHDPNEQRAENQQAKPQMHHQPQARENATSMGNHGSGGAGAAHRTPNTTPSFGMNKVSTPSEHPATAAPAARFMGNSSPLPSASGTAGLRAPSLHSVPTSSADNEPKPQAQPSNHILGTTPQAKTDLHKPDVSGYNHDQDASLSSDKTGPHAEEADNTVQDHSILDIPAFLRRKSKN